MPDGTNVDARAQVTSMPGGGGRPAPRSSAPTLAWHLSALVAAVAVPLLVVAGWGVWTAQLGIRQEAETALLARAGTVAARTEREFDRAEALLRALASSAALVRGDMEALEEEMRAASRTAGDLPVALRAPGGAILAEVRGRAGQPAQAWAEVTLATPGPTDLLVTDLLGAPGGPSVVAVGVQLSGTADVAPGGALWLALPRERLSAALREAAALGETDGPQGSAAVIIDRAGTIVARTAGEEGMVGTPARPTVLPRLMAVPEGVLNEIEARDGIPVVAAFLRGSRSGFTYVLNTPRAEFEQPLRAAMLRTVLAGGAVLLLGLGLALLLARRTVAAFQAAQGAALRGRPDRSTGLREADELARALGEAASERRRFERALRLSERRNREVLESLGERLYALDRQGRIRFASRATLEGWGVTADAIMGRPIEEVFPRIIGNPTWEATRRALTERQEVHLCGVSVLVGQWVEVDAYPSADGGVTVSFRDIEALRRAHRERAGALEALRGVEERQRLALEAAELGAWEIDLRAGTIRRSARTLEIFGVGPEFELAPFPSPIWAERIHPADREAAARLPQEAILGKRDGYRLEFRFQRPSDGRWVWAENHGRVVARDPATGRAIRIAGATRDVTERRAAEERQTLLAREVDHRAKNALAVVQAAVRLTPKDDAAAFARAIEGRVHALARAQTLLAADRWTSADLRGVIQGELAPFLAAGQAQPQAVLDGPRVALPAGVTQPLAMAVHELATNAVKHGALSTPGGRVEVSWSLEARGAAPLLRLRWSESGGPAVTGAPARRGFGSRVLEGTVRGQLRGEVTTRWAEGGLVCTITVPLRDGPAQEAGAAT